MRITALSLLPVLALSLIADPRQLPDVPHVDTVAFLPAIGTQIKLAESMARAHPNDPQAVGQFAMTLHAYQQYETAADAYSRARQLEPDKFDWLYLLGAVRMELGEFKAAFALFQSALNVEPDNLAAALRLAQVLTTLSRYPEAETQYQRMLAKHPECPQAWYGIGRTRAAEGNHGAAIQSFAKAYDLFPQYGAAHFAAAQELRKVGRTADALLQMKAYEAHPATQPFFEDPLFLRILELNHGPQAHMQKAAELEKAGRLEDAIHEDEAALAVDATDVQAHINLISLYGRTGDATKARGQFDSAVRLDPGRADAWYDFGVLLMHERDMTGSERAFHRVLEINPDYAEARYRLGLIYEQQTRLDDAAREFQNAIRIRPDYPDAHFHLGRILVNEQKYDAAIYQLSRSLEPEGDNTPTYLYALAATFARAGRRAEALLYFQKARDGARALGQKQLLSSIERDLDSFSSAQ